MERSPDYISPLDRFYHWEKTQPDAIFLRQPVNGEWITYTWQQAGTEIRKICFYLAAMNLPEKSSIALISKNCAHWIMTDLAIMMAGHVSVPLYPNLHADTVRQILEHSGSRLLFVGKLDDWDSMKTGVPDGMPCITFPYYGQSGYRNWTEIIAEGKAVQTDRSREAAELCTIVYTSGTTGTPKGVMHSFQNISFTLQQSMEPFGLSHEARFISYLPLSHIAERLLVEMGTVYTGATLYFTESLEKFPQNLFEAQPTIFFAVHRIWKKFQEGIWAKLPQKRLDLLLRIPLLSGLIKRKIKKQLGLAKAQTILTGASPTPAALLQWYARLGINIQEAYGLTENCVYSTLTRKDNIKPGFVGQPLPNCQVILGDQQEVLIKHDALMMGYYRDAELTAAVFTPDGFLKTGDEGFFDAEGSLKITGRIKELFKTSKGKYVAPSPIEMKIAESEWIEWVCVVGSDLPQPMAMIILSVAAKQRERKMMQDLLHQLIQRVNAQLDASERLGKLIVLTDDWTVENGLLTPSLKIKRNLVEKKYTDRYEAWSLQHGTVLWEK